MSTSATDGTAADLAAKRRLLEDGLRQLGSLIVAYSGGVDSALVMSVANNILGDRTVAVTSATWAGEGNISVACMGTTPSHRAARSETLGPFWEPVPSNPGWLGRFEADSSRIGWEEPHWTGQGVRAIGGEIPRRGWSATR